MTKKTGQITKQGGKGLTDNATPEGKLALRRYFLSRYHAERKPVVLDCCQAGGVLWGTLRREFTVQYWGVDRVAKKGRLAVDSARLLTTPGLPYDIIDVDTYGSPWQHWKNLLPNLVKPTTVFLTLGKAGGITAIDSAVIQSLGLQRMKRSIPQALRWKLDQLAVDSCLAMSYIYGVRIQDARRDSHTRADSDSRAVVGPITQSVRRTRILRRGTAATRRAIRN